MVVAGKPQREVKEAQYLSRTVNTGAAFFCPPQTQSLQRLVDPPASNFNPSCPPLSGKHSGERDPVVGSVSQASELTLSLAAPKAGPALSHVLGLT